MRKRAESADQAMKNPDDTKNTPGTDAAFDLLGRIVVDPETDKHYPNETVLTAADSPHASKLIARAVAAHRLLVIVYPEGREIFAAPRDGALAFVECLLTRRREAKHGTPSVPLPADYQVEISDRQTLTAA
jgi:hypothetical protein